MLRKRMLKKVLFPVLSFCLVLLSACASGTNSGTSGSGDSSSAPASAVKGSTEAFTLTVMVSSGELNVEMQNLRYKVPSFIAKYPNVQLQYTALRTTQEAMQKQVEQMGK